MLLLLTACAARSQEAPPRADAASTPAAAAPSASAVTAVHASAPDAGACALSMLQPGACAPVPASLSFQATGAWFAARGVREDAWHYASCDELRFGAEPESVLLCADDAPFWTDPATGMNTRVEFARHLVVVTVQHGKPLELLRVPLAVGDDNLEDVIFTSNYRVDAPAGAVDIEVSKADCDAAPKRLDAYQAEKMQGLRDNSAIDPPFLKLILNAERHAATQDLARIRLICKAAGHYVTQRGGKLAR